MATTITPTSPGKSFATPYAPPAPLKPRAPPAPPANGGSTVAISSRWLAVLCLLAMAPHC